MTLYVLLIMGHFLFAEEDECQPNPCLNGGRCMAHFFGGGFDCECPLGYRGTTCRGRLQIHKYGIAKIEIEHTCIILELFTSIRHDIWISLFGLLS